MLKVNGLGVLYSNLPNPHGMRGSQQEAPSKKHGSSSAWNAVLPARSMDLKPHGMRGSQQGNTIKLMVLVFS
jgi:hypothetical protein